MSKPCTHRYVKFINVRSNTVFKAFRAKCRPCARKYYHIIKSSLGKRLDDIIIDQLHLYLKTSDETPYKKNCFAYKVAKEFNLLKWLVIPPLFKYKKIRS